MVPAQLPEAGGVSYPKLPAIRQAKTRPGYLHPATPTDIVEVIDALGDEVVYGLRSIELAQARPGTRGRLIFGSFALPDRILLYEVRRPPWTIRASPDPTDIMRMTEAGARVAAEPVAGVTTVEWPGETLKWFFLLDVLLHELGHHHAQQYRRRFRSRALRTKDHEAYAQQFARIHRRRLGSTGS